MQGRSCRQFSGNGFGRPSAKTQFFSGSYFGQVQRKGTTLANFLAVALAGQVQGRNCRQFSGTGLICPVQGCCSRQFSGAGLIGPVQGCHSRRFSGIGFGRPSARTQLSQIFWHGHRNNNPIRIFARIKVPCERDTETDTKTKTETETETEAET